MSRAADGTQDSDSSDRRRRGRWSSAAAGAYAYDSSQKDKIADGVTIAGVDVGGLNAAEAKPRCAAQLLAPLRHSLQVSFDGRELDAARRPS